MEQVEKQQVGQLMFYGQVETLLLLYLAVLEQ
jgi:hypothetical protein